MNFVRVNGYPDYVIHPAGTILKIYKHKTKEMKTCKSMGYVRIALSNNGKTKKFQVHRLLALHFIENADPDNKLEIDHINGIRDDNRLENLRWVTHKENMNGFRSNRGVFAEITKGNIYKRENSSWQWHYLMKGKRKTKQMKSKQDLEKYKDEILKKYNVIL